MLEKANKKFSVPEIIAFVYVSFNFLNEEDDAFHR